MLVFVKYDSHSKKYNPRKRLHNLLYNICMKTMKMKCMKPIKEG